MTDKPIIWIISNQQWPRAYLRAELIERGFDAVGFSALEDALAALCNPHQKRPHIIVLEFSGLLLTGAGLDALAQAGIPTIALAGAVHWNEEFISEFEWAVLLKRPLTIGQVADRVEELVTSRNLALHSNLMDDNDHFLLE